MDLLEDLPAPFPRRLGKYRSAEIGAYLTETDSVPEDVLTLHTARPNKDRHRDIQKAIELWNNGHKRLNYNNDLPEEPRPTKQIFLTGSKLSRVMSPAVTRCWAPYFKGCHFYPSGY